MSLIQKLYSLSAKAFLGIAVVIAAQWTMPTKAAGTLPLAMAQQMDINGQPVLCQVTFFAAGTPATLQNAYADFGLTQQLPNPLACDQTGRVPMFWLADGLIHVRMIDGNGLPIIDTTMQVLGPSSGGGGGGSTVDPTTIASTGSLTWRLDKDPLAGWVRINGLTIGNTSSGATERANADTQSLYVYIWTKFSQPSGNVICPVVGGLGANALADFNANKPITLEDGRSATLFAVDDMGNSARGGFVGMPFVNGNATTGGSRGGTNSTTLALSQLPGGITSAGTNLISVSGSNSFSASGVNSFSMSGNNSISVTGNTTVNVDQGITASSTGGGAFPFNGVTSQSTAAVSASGNNNISVSGSPNISVSGSVSINSTGSNSISVTSNNTGGLPFPSVPNTLLGTLFWKL
jgi:hypothetical protein